MAVGGGAVWVAHSTDGTLLRIDPAANKVVGEPLEIGPRAQAVAVGAGAVWVASQAADTLIRVAF